MLSIHPDEIRTQDVIWKFPFRADHNGVHIEIPRNAQILHIDIQHGKICVWARVNPENIKLTRKIYTIGTGHSFSFDVPTTHIGTILEKGGLYVWHVFLENEVST